MSSRRSGHRGFISRIFLAIRRRSTRNRDMILLRNQGTTNRDGVAPEVSGRASMLPRTDSVATIAENWLAQFEGALTAPRASLNTLFHADSHWRDVLALT